MKAKVRLASKARATAAAMAARCEALAKDAEARALTAVSGEDRQAATDEALAYYKMASDWHATETRAETISPRRFSAKNTGTNSQTVSRQAFLDELAKKIGTRKHEAVAQEAVTSSAKEVFTLWRSRGEIARNKLLNFMRNHRF